MQKIKLSILDLAQFSEDKESPSEVLRRSTEVAQLADRLGYTRYWFAEHHNMPFLMSMFPEIMVAHVAAHTKRIRVGTGGVMLPNHSAFNVAERFAMLEALHPGRIDLGIGRAPGTDGRTAFALRRTWDVIHQDIFPNQLEDLLGFLGHNLPDNHPFRNIKASPDPSLSPEVFVLGSSTGGVQFAIQHGLPFAFAGQINAGYAIPVLNTYRKKFKPSAYLSEPKSILSIIVFTAETEEEARYHAAPAILHWTLLSMGNKITSPTLKDANAHVYTGREKLVREEVLRKFVIGTPDQVAEQLHQWASATQTDEIMLFDMYNDFATRKKSYELLAKQFGLEESVE